MDEKRIEQVLEIENQAQAIHEAALHEAEQLPKQAEKEAQALIDKARSEAEEEARRMIDLAQVEDESKHILAQAEEDARRTEALAMTNFDRGVAYVLKHVIGRE
jgi:V/A-type H+-transporting ATPase subunit G/H